MEEQRIRISCIRRIVPCFVTNVILFWVREPRSPGAQDPTCSSVTRPELSVLSASASENDGITGVKAISRIPIFLYLPATYSELSADSIRFGSRTGGKVRCNKIWVNKATDVVHPHSHPSGSAGKSLRIKSNKMEDCGFICPSESRT